MIIKVTGAALVIIGTLITGMNKSKKFKNRYNNLEIISNCFEFIINEIKLNNETLDDIFIKVSSVHSFDKIFKTVAKKSKDKPIYERWREGICEDYREINLSNDDRDILLLFGEMLGKNDKCGQINSCERIINLLKKPIEKAYDEYKNMSKIYRNLYLMSGLFIVIFLF